MLAEMLAPLRLEQRDYVFAPVNNHRDIHSVGGSHWCLLRRSLLLTGLSGLYWCMHDNPMPSTIWTAPAT
jgi:hypothetical protein